MKLSQNDIGTSYRELLKALNRMEIGKSNILNKLDAMRTCPANPAFLNYLANEATGLSHPIVSLGINAELLCESEPLEQDRLIDIQEELDGTAWKDEPSRALEEQLRRALEAKQLAIDEQTRIAKAHYGDKKSFSIRYERMLNKSQRQLDEKDANTAELQLELSKARETIASFKAPTDLDDVCEALREEADNNTGTWSNANAEKMAFLENLNSESKKIIEESLEKNKQQTIELTAMEKRAVLAEETIALLQKNLEDASVGLDAAKNQSDILQEELDALKECSSDRTEEIQRDSRHLEEDCGLERNSIQVHESLVPYPLSGAETLQVIAGAVKLKIAGTPNTRRARAFQASVVLVAGIGLSSGCLPVKGSPRLSRAAKDLIARNAQRLIDEVRKRVADTEFAHDNIDDLKDTVEAKIRQASNPITMLIKKSKHIYDLNPPTTEDERYSMHVEERKVFKKLGIFFGNT